uniref:BTB domain-containing protein n=1 Tax=Scleropages formosus TaxID=113540 RepID=A0A8C9VUF1_SCLFO
MAGNSACNAKCVGDEILDAKREREGEPDTKESASKEVPSSPYFEVIDGVLYRKKLEKGFINYREVLDKERRQNAIATFHHKRPGSRHHTLEDTYRYVAENYWWEGSGLTLLETCKWSKNVFALLTVRGTLALRFVRTMIVYYIYACMSWLSPDQIRSKSLVSKTLESHSNDLLGKLKGQWEEGLFCDITLKTGGRSFCAHKAVLAAVSEYFQEIFAEMASSPTPQSDIDLTGE